MQVAQFVRKYSTQVSSGPVPKDRINSTLKWAEYSTDIIKMTELLRTASFLDKYKLVAAIEVAERKKNWHYRQENFNLRRASYIVQKWIAAEK